MTETTQQEKIDGSTEVVMKSFADLAAQSSGSANEKIDKLSGLLIQAGFALGGLAAIRLPGVAFEYLPLTYVGIAVIAVSIVCGAAQFIFDYYFFKRASESARKVSTAAFGAYFIQGTKKIEAGGKMISFLDAHERMPSVSTYCPLIIQFILLFMGFIFIMIELPL